MYWLTLYSNHISLKKDIQQDKYVFFKIAIDNIYRIISDKKII
jgi:hypothetical protein